MIHVIIVLHPVYNDYYFLYRLMPKRKSSQKRYRQPTNVTEQADIKGTDTWSDNDDPDQHETDENLLTIVRGVLNNLRQVGEAFS